MNAIITGAGIAGPAMAIALKRLGMGVTLYEAREDNEMGGGVFLGLTPNGLNILKAFIDTGLLRNHYTAGTMEFYNARNKCIGRLDTRDQARKYGAETIQVKRARVGELLRQEAAREGIDIRYCHRLRCLRERAGGVEASFDNGHSHAAAFLIACDGIHSACRSALFPEAQKPVYTQQISTGAMMRLNGPQLPFGAIKMTFGQRGFFACAASNQGEVWWFSNFHREKEPDKNEIHAALQKEIKAQLLEIHQNDPAHIPEIIRQTGEMFAYPVYEMPLLPRWHSRRVCLIGDAAHATAPHTGQGASLALEDVIVLSQCLNSSPNTAEAFARFQQARKPRVEKIVKQARKVGSAKSKPNPIATFFRDLMLRHFIRFEKKKMDWVYRYQPDGMEIPGN